MSERERWIVYPLLFFVGSALRDKLLQQIETKNIRCESLQIIDPRNPQRVLAELTVAPSRGTVSGEPSAVLQVHEVKIVDRKNPSQALAVLGTAPLPNHGTNQPPKRVGMLILQDAERKQRSELRADRLLNNHVVTQQLSVIDPVKKYPRFIAATQQVGGSVADGSDSTLDHEGVLYLNNRLITPSSNRPASRRTLQP